MQSSPTYLSNPTLALLVEDDLALNPEGLCNRVGDPSINGIAPSSIWYIPLRTSPPNLFYKTEQKV